MATTGISARPAQGGGDGQSHFGLGQQSLDDGRRRLDGERVEFRARAERWRLVRKGVGSRPLLPQVDVREGIGALGADALCGGEHLGVVADPHMAACWVRDQLCPRQRRCDVAGRVAGAEAVVLDRRPLVSGLSAAAALAGSPSATARGARAGSPRGPPASPTPPTAADPPRSRSEAGAPRGARRGSR